MADSDHKVAKTSADAWSLQEIYEGKPHGWVQWKGTNVCMDVHCKCGALGHVDADFAYHVKCGACGAVYMVNGHVEFIEVLYEPGGVAPVVSQVDGDKDADGERDRQSN